jgi:recombination protein RecA
MSTRAQEISLESIESQLKVKFRSADDIPEFGRLTTGIPSLDYILDGGYPVGRIIELFGPEETGKTTILYEAIVSACKAGLPTLFVDGERSFDKARFKRLGLPDGSLKVIKPDYGEQGFRAIRGASKILGLKFVGVDSITALIPHQQFAKEDENPIALQARMMSNELKLLASSMDNNQTVCILLNQIRTHMAGGRTWSDTTSGKALRFYSSVRIGLDQAKVTPECRYTRIFVRKNKTGAPLRTTVVRIIYGLGVDKDFDLVQLALLKGTVKEIPGEAKSNKGVAMKYEHEGKRKNWKTIAKLLKGETTEDTDETEVEEIEITIKNQDDDNIEGVLAKTPEPIKEKAKRGPKGKGPKESKSGSDVEE